MQQAINLFDHLEKNASVKVASQHIAGAAIVTILILMVISLSSIYNARQDAQRLLQAEKKDQRLQAQLSELRANSTNDSKSIQRTRRLLKQRQQILRSLSNQQQDMDVYF
jgi:uncharacterized membrane-anchored protein